MFEPAPHKGAAPLHIVGNVSRLWFLLLDNWLSFYSARCRVKKQRGCVTCCLFKYFFFFSVVNANLLQTSLELISALPAIYFSVKDSNWNFCLTVTKADFKILLYCETGSWGNTQRSLGWSWVSCSAKLCPRTLCRACEQYRYFCE